MVLFLAASILLDTADGTFSLEGFAICNAWGGFKVIPNVPPCTPGRAAHNREYRGTAGGKREFVRAIDLLRRVCTCPNEGVAASRAFPETQIPVYGGAGN